MIQNFNFYGIYHFKQGHFLTRFKNPWWAVGFLLLAIFGLGNWLARTYALTWRQRGTYLLLGWACILVSLRCLGAYRAFAVEFAKAVYRGFYDFKDNEAAAES